MQLSRHASGHNLRVWTSEAQNWSVYNISPVGAGRCTRRKSWMYIHGKGRSVGIASRWSRLGLYALLIKCKNALSLSLFSSSLAQIIKSCFLRSLLTQEIHYTVSLFLHEQPKLFTVVVNTKSCQTPEIGNQNKADKVKNVKSLLTMEL